MSTQSIDDLNFVSEVRKQMNENRLMLSYSGKMSQEIVVALLNLTENKLNQSDTDSTTKTRVFSVLVECLQNITQHSEKDNHSGSSMFMIGQTDDDYSIYSGNVIRAGDKVTELKDKISKLNTMSEEELKEFHKYWIRNESLNPKNGFGLGLIHIARKTGNPLEFDFEKVDSDHYFFSLKTKVDR
jgi:hypothetical protein